MNTSSFVSIRRRIAVSMAALFLATCLAGLAHAKKALPQRAMGRDLEHERAFLAAGDFGGRIITARHGAGKIVAHFIGLKACESQCSLI